jgi:NAD(P)-dependent dehydrogenase (short-subunit alcohol dehydrogenase family)
MNMLAHKIALITGGTSGMGAATAKRFHAEGATVIVTGSNSNTAETARKAMPGVEVIASDAGDPTATKKLVDQIREKHGHIDVLFANAGIARVAPLAAADEAHFDELFRVNVRGPYFLLKHAVPVMTDGGSIILTLSIGALQGMPGLSVYSGLHQPSQDSYGTVEHVSIMVTFDSPPCGSVQRA